jgi:hypothetical protein
MRPTAILVILVLTAGILGCSHCGVRSLANEDAPRDCMSRDELMEAAEHLKPYMVVPQMNVAFFDTPYMKKLDPTLREFVRDIVRAAGEPSSEGPECFPKSVNVVIVFKGPKERLEAVGVADVSGGGHPDGDWPMTGRIPTALILDVARLEGLIGIDGGGHYSPE